MADLAVLRRLQSSALGAEELEEIHRRYPNDTRVLLGLVQHPRFPQATALGILSKLFAADLVRVIKNVKANPYVRKKAELEFLQRYRRLALGEKVSLVKSAPNSLLLALTDEDQPPLLQAILQNPNCSEEVVLRFVNRAADRGRFYQAFDDTAWHQSAAVAEAVAHDPEAPVRALLKIIPHLGLAGLQRLFRDAATHPAVRERIRDYLDRRG